MDYRKQISKMKTKELEKCVDNGEFNGPSLEYANQVLMRRYKKPHWSQTLTFLFVVISALSAMVAAYFAYRNFYKSPVPSFHNGQTEVKIKNKTENYNRQ